MTLHPKASFAPTLSACPSPEVSDRGADFVDDVLALRPALKAFARRLTNQTCDADDLVQDTILRAIVARHQFTRGTNLKAWLFTILRNSFNSRWRKTQREVVTGSEVIELSTFTPANQEKLLWAHQVADRLLHDLSPAHRQVLLLVPVQGLSYEDAAQICGCSIGTVKSRLNRARAALVVLVDGTACEGDWLQGTPA